MRYFLGFDIGSVSINTVVMDQDGAILRTSYDYCRGRPYKILKRILHELSQEFPSHLVERVVFTGTGGGLAAETTGGSYVNEVVAQACAVAKLYPQIRTIIEMGGEDSKLIFMEPSSEQSGYRSRLEDFAMNSICAAGTGSFLDQQARRIGVSIEGEFGRLALMSEEPPRIAGRCSVFAKSDMIHLQQIATPVHDIVAGLCFAVARNYKSTLAQGRDLAKPVCFQGGVAANAGMVRAFREIFGLAGQELIVPELHACMGAIGALYKVLDSEDLDETDAPGATASAGRPAALEGVAQSGRPDASSGVFDRAFRNLSGFLQNRETDSGDRLDPLVRPEAAASKQVESSFRGPVDAFLGLDVGSLSTNVVLIDWENRVIARRYLPTASRPLEAIREALAQIQEEVGDRVTIRGVGATGSGRYLTGDFVGADCIRNEITAQATAAAVIDPEVDTIFEIGGQDSKFISLENGVVVDFEMNKVCAAGTGSFLEEQAEKLGIDIREFGEIALEAPEPARLGDRCTVFMESDLNAHQQKGVETENLISGLACSIVHNYLQKVVGNKRVGNRVFFQGGVANNQSVVAAFGKVTGKTITVPPHFDVTGAIGAAILARRQVTVHTNGGTTACTEKGDANSGTTACTEMAGGAAHRTPPLVTTGTRFKGFDISTRPFSVGRFTCGACANQCEIQRVSIEGEKKPLFYGGRCERYEVEERREAGRGIPNLFAERERMLTEGYTDAAAEAGSGSRAGVSAGAGASKDAGVLKDSSSHDTGSIDTGGIDTGGIDTGECNRTRTRTRTLIGIPRALMVYHQQFPFWRTFFAELGFEVVLSDSTNRRMVTRSLEQLQAETCFPTEVMIGHVRDLLEKGCDHLFLPSIINAPAGPENPTKNYNCPWIQTIPYMMRAALSDDPERERLLIPVLHMRYPRVARRELSHFMQQRLGVPARRTAAALDSADRAQQAFERRIEERGREVLDNLPPGARAVVILGRPYNTADPELNLHLVEKLISLDAYPIPLDYLPVSSVDIHQDYPMMYWPNGSRILAAARITASDPRLHAVYMGNFRCGPDSFLSHFVREEMKGKPCLQLEVDEHGADAGMITRCEAFLDSLEHSRSGRGRVARSGAAGLRSGAAGRDSTGTPGSKTTRERRGRIMYIPNVSDQTQILAAVSRFFGMQAEVLPPTDAAAMDLGRRYTSSRECFPMTCTTGQFLKKIMEPGFVPERAGFFMPDHNGPCRFGQYNRLQRIIFDRLGYGDVSIISPSNDDAYGDLSGGHGIKFRLYTWKGVVAADLLRKLLHERRPYEMNPGEADRLYQEHLGMLIRAVEQGCRDVGGVLEHAVDAFGRMPLSGVSKPVVSVTGEVFMRDNPPANGFIVRRLEALGAEVLVTPIREWINYSSYRYRRDSLWERSPKGLLQSLMQLLFQGRIEENLVQRVRGSARLDRDIHVDRMLELCERYITRHYDGQPALVLGSTSGQVDTGIHGVVNVMPFTCMPETFTTAVTPLFRKDHGNIPWVNIAYDGQDDPGIDIRLQAFMHQVGEYARR